MFNNLSFVALFLVAGGLGALGNLLLKAGMNNLGGLELAPGSLWLTMGKLLGDWRIVVGFAFYGVSSILYLKLILFGEVTRIYPAIVSYMFILLLVLGAVFLKEPLTAVKVLSIGIIILGITLAGR